MNKIFAIASALILACGCRQKPSEYTGLEYRGGKDIRITAFSSVDTIYIDASATSLEGQWHLSKGKLLFLDRYMVGVREYDVQGNFISRHINRGRGPNEMTGPAYLSETTDDGGLVMIDSSWWIYLYDSLYRKSPDPQRFLSDLGANSFDWNDLLRNPDPEVKHMYEIFFLANRIKISDSIMIMPVITEHVRYNGYEIGSNAKKYWEETYNMIFIDLKNKITGDLFGSYPHVYRENNIPVFSQFDFDINKEKESLYMGFAADSLIYVRDLKNGRLLYGFGCAAQGISTLYPSTGSFAEYETVYKDHMEKYGYYTQLVQAGDYVFRGYKKEGITGYGFQVYRDNMLIGDIHTNEQIQIIGEYNDVFYGVLSADLDDEFFRILKFTLPNLAVSGHPPLPSAIGQEAKLVFVDERIVQVANVKTDSIFRKEIRIRNDGDANLLILNYKLSCRCTKVTLPTVLRPGEEGKIIIEIDTTDKLGKSINTVLFETNTTQKDYVIRVDMNVVP